MASVRPHGVLDQPTLHIKTVAEFLKGKQRKSSMVNSLALVRLNILAAIMVSATSFVQKSQPALQIESPPDGTVVNPGQTVSVRVTSPRGIAVSFVGVVGENPLNSRQVAKSLPAEFSITIPSNINSCRRYMLTAMARTVAGEEPVESMIDVDVERPDTPISIVSFQFPSLTLVADPKAQPFHLIILATFADRSNVEVTESSYVTYQSTNDAVATVERFGGVMAVAPGIASIKVTYKNPNGGNVQVSVPVIVEPPSKN